MAKAFKKGDKVTFLADWDRKGTVYYVNAVVYSCGAKKMVLTSEETGEEMGRNFLPTVGTLENGGTFPRMTDEEATEAGLVLAAAVQESERAHLARCLERGYGEAYDNSIRKQVEELHNLRVIKR